MAAGRPDVPEFLATEPDPGAGRQSGGDWLAPAAGLDAFPGAGRGSFGALSGRRLLARPATAAGAPALERLWLLVPGGAGRDDRAAAGRHPRDYFRSGDPYVPDGFCPRRRRDGAARGNRPGAYCARRWARPARYGRA